MPLLLKLSSFRLLRFRKNAHVIGRDVDGKSSIESEARVIYIECEVYVNL